MSETMTMVERIEFPKFDTKLSEILIWSWLGGSNIHSRF